MTRLTELPWSFIAKNFNAHNQLQNKLREKARKLERVLTHFPDGSVHLQTVLERHVRKNQFKASLVLKLPSNTLLCEKWAIDPIPAFDRAIKALLREVAALKAELRREPQWHQAVPA